MMMMNSVNDNDDYFDDNYDEFLNDPKEYTITPIFSPPVVVHRAVVLLPG